MIKIMQDLSIAPEFYRISLVNLADLNADSLNPDPDLSTIIVMKGTAPLVELRSLGLHFGQRVIAHAGKTSGVIVLLFKERVGMKTMPCVIIALDYPQLPTQYDGRYGECLVYTTHKAAPLSSVWVICCLPSVAALYLYDIALPPPIALLLCNSAYPLSK